MPTLEADGMITIYEIETGNVVAQYEGMEVHRIMLACQAAQQGVSAELLSTDAFEEMPHAVDIIASEENR